MLGTSFFIFGWGVVFGVIFSGEVNAIFIGVNWQFFSHKGKLLIKALHLHLHFYTSFH